VDPTKKNLLWKFSDSRTSVGDFFDPRSDTNYVLCAYDSTAGDYRLVIDTATESSGGVALPSGSEPAGATCVVKRRTGELGDCWTLLQRGDNPSTGYRYRDRRRRSEWEDLTNGARTVWLRAGRGGQLFGGVIFFRAGGINLPAPSGTTATDKLFDQQSTVVVQLVNSKGSCWEARYTSPARINRPFRGGLLFRDETD